MEKMRRDAQTPLKRQKPYPGPQADASVMCVCVTMAAAGLYGLPIRTLPELASLCGVLMICKI